MLTIITISLIGLGAVSLFVIAVLFTLWYLENK